MRKVVGRVAPWLVGFTARAERRALPAVGGNSILLQGLSLVERLFAFVLLVSLLPMLLVTALLIHTTAGESAILCDEFPNNDGGISRRLRFRTTGPGTPFFRALGPLLRKYSIDEFPALWSVARGDIKLRELSNDRR